MPDTYVMNAVSLIMTCLHADTITVSILSHTDRKVIADMFHEVDDKIALLTTRVWSRLRKHTEIQAWRQREIAYRHGDDVSV